MEALLEDIWYPDAREMVAIGEGCSAHLDSIMQGTLVVAL